MFLNYKFKEIGMVGFRTDWCAIQIVLTYDKAAKGSGNTHKCIC